MSWSVFVSPLHHVVANGGLEWAAAASYTYGIPDHVPASRELPRLADVLTAIRSAGCHGTAWFDTEGLDTDTSLPPCPNPASCAAVGGLDLGEVSLHVPDQVTAVRVDTAVEAVTFRKPTGVAMLRTACALAAGAGALLVFDDNADQVFVVSPGDQPEDLAAHWPW